jgi:hypothetical protein
MNKTTLAIGALSLAALAAMVWWFLPGGVTTPTDDPGGVAAAFLAEVRAGKVDQAWDGTGTEFKSFMGKDQFRQFVKKHAALKTQATAGETTAQGALRECVFICGSLKVIVIVGNSGGQWKVEGIRAG